MPAPTVGARIVACCGAAVPAELPASYNIAPTQQVLVARELDGKREGVAMRWGLIPFWAKDKKMLLINARADTLFTKPAFRASAKRRRTAGRRCGCKSVERRC